MWRAGTRLQPFHATLCDATVGRYPGKCQNPECEKDVTIHKHLVNDPLVYSLVIVHESDNVSKEALQRTLAAVDDEIDLSQIYAADPNDPNPPPPRRAVLRHAHYVALKNQEVQDPANVNRRQLGPVARGPRRLPRFARGRSLALTDSRALRRKE